MVRKKRSVNELNGYQVPSKPRRSRSTKNKPCNKKLDGETMCAIDLLATVAQELLQEKNSYSSLAADLPAPALETDATKIEPMDKVKQFKQKPYGQGSCVESSLFLHEHVPNKSDDNILMEHSLDAEGVFNQYTSDSIYSKKADEPGKPVFECLSGTVGNSFVSSAAPDIGIFKDEALSISVNGCPIPEGDNFVEDARIGDQGNGSTTHPLVSNSCFSEEKITVDRFPTLASSDGCVKVPFCGDNSPRKNFVANFHSGSKVVRRDDDENSFGCTDSSTKTKEFHKSPNVTDLRIRKFMASRYFKVPPKVLRKGELFNVDHVIKSLDRGRKFFSTRQRIKRLSSYKKKKFSDRPPFSLKYDRSNCNGGPTNFNGKTFQEETPVYNAKRRGAKSPPSPLVAERSSYGSVKLRIQSVNIPELFVEIPETATVGVLKRTVLEAVTSILSRGIRVGVLLQGKKVKDDDITLFQSGISFEKKLDSLGFALEPGHTQISFPPAYKENTHCSSGVDFHVVARQSVMHPFNNVASHVSMEQSLPNVCQLGQSAYAFVPSSSIRAFDNVLQRPQALVAIPEMNLETLAVTPFYTKYRRPELSQRRTRRPFSVMEVEALVQAVENLGTGRWRDVKMRAFEDADHRTYVDLKDKWKTLVHTARISPQQRRGEPVPQVLLDRVLAAHSYWSQLQSTQQGNEGNEQGEACMPLDPQ